MSGPGELRPSFPHPLVKIRRATFDHASYCGSRSMTLRYEQILSTLGRSWRGIGTSWEDFPIVDWYCG